MKGIHTFHTSSSFLSTFVFLLLIVLFSLKNNKWTEIHLNRCNSDLDGEKICPHEEGGCAPLLVVALRDRKICYTSRRNLPHRSYCINTNFFLWAMATSKPISCIKITVPEIKEKLKEKGLSVSGTKQILYDRLYGISSKTTAK